MRSEGITGKTLPLLLSLALAALLVMSFACGDDDDDDGGDDNGGDETSAASATDGGDGGGDGGEFEVIATDFAFDPSELSVAAGSDVSITMTNEGAAPHNLRVAGEDGEYDTDDDAVTDPDNIGGGESGTLEWTAPEAAGDFEFRCDFHPAQMTGTITVE
jgi:plastocyanin